MTKTEAIEILNEARPPSFWGENPKLEKAMILGSEALERCKYISEHTTRWADVLLPSETKEGG